MPEMMNETDFEQSDKPALIQRLKEAYANLEKHGHEKKLFKQISSVNDLTELLDILGKEIDSLHEFDGYLINLLDESQENLVCEKIKLPEQFHGIEKTYLKYKFPKNMVDANVRAFLKREVTYVNKDNVSEYPGSTKTRFERWNMSMLVVIPIQDEDSCVGTLMAFMQDGVISEANVAHLLELLSYFNTQIKNALFYAKVKRQEKIAQDAEEEYQRFLSFVTAINDLTSVEMIYEMMSKELLRRFRFDLAGVFMKEGDQLVVKKNTIIDEKYTDIYNEWNEYFPRTRYDIDVSDGTAPTAFIQNSRMFVPDVLEIMHLPMSDKDKEGLRILRTPRTFLAVPIRQHNAPVGLIWLWTLDSTIRLTESDLKMVELLCSFIGTAIANAHLYSTVEDQKEEIEKLNGSLQQKVEQLHDMASKDRLTQLYNFGFFQEELRRRIHEYRRTGGRQQMALVIVDIDHFKKFNDTHGHVAGNIALQEVANRIHRLARRMDIVCRYGGEEFIVILPRCDITGAKNFAERIRAEVERTPVKTDTTNVPVTISVGCSSFLPNEEAENFIERADQALYRAKEGGRNRVEIA